MSQESKPSTYFRTKYLSNEMSPSQMFQDLKFYNLIIQSNVSNISKQNASQQNISDPNVSQFSIYCPNHVHIFFSFLMTKSIKKGQKQMSQSLFSTLKESHSQRLKANVYPPSSQASRVKLVNSNYDLEPHRNDWNRISCIQKTTVTTEADTLTHWKAQLRWRCDIHPCFSLVTMEDTMAYNR